MIVGLTGGIGSGKSTVAKMFKKLGVPVYDSDKEAKLLMNTSRTVREAIVDLLGEESYLKNRLNREYIAEKVFKDQVLLEKLNKIVHPEVKKHFKAWCVKQNYEYVVQESALIFENKSQENYDKVVLVTAPLSVRINRVIKRDNVSESSVLIRISNQLTDAEKLNLADYTVENIDLEATAESIKNIHDQLLEEAQLT
jgi:dephospho-CoA kinase